MANPAVENTIKDKFRFYPNPAQNLGYLAYDLATVDKATLQIYNTLGQPIEQKQLLKENKVIELSLDNYSNGLYLYTIVANGKIIYQGKFVISKD